MSQSCRLRLAALATAVLTGSAIPLVSSDPARADPVDDASDSLNYAGVIAFPSNGAFDHVLAQWAEPRLHCGLPAVPPAWPTFGIWAGLGTGKSNTQPLVQGGTVNECTGGVAENHTPFYAIYPNEGTTRLGPSEGAGVVKAGDVMQAEVWTGTTRYEIAIRNVTQRWDTGRISIALDRMGGAAGAADARGQAAWVAERPAFNPGSFDPRLVGCAQEGNIGYRPLASFDDESTADPNDLVIRGRTGAATTFEAVRAIGTSGEGGQVLMEPDNWVRDQAQGDATAWVKWRASGC